MRREMPSVATRRVAPFALCLSPFAFRLSKLQRRGGKIKHLGQTMPCGPRFLFTLFRIVLEINYI